jgi:TolB-like protein/DNA-binding winged helix-turn-helix (wHTH) protein/Tfp pilus assembly protein PilF
MSGPESRIVYEFGDFRLDSSRRLLFATGETEPRAIPPKAFDTMLYFVEHHGELLDKDRLIAELWPGLVVEENSLTQVISLLRRVLGEVRGENRYFVTVPGRGYRFVAGVTRLPEVPETEPARSPLAPAPQGKLPRSKLAALIALAGSASVIALVAYAWHVGWWRANEPERPAPAPAAPAVIELPSRSVAVLAFQNLSAAPNSDLFAAGLADTVLHQLASLRDVTVIAGTSSFLFKDRNLDSRTIGRKLNARYLLEGSVQSDKDRLRVTAQLIDAQTANHVWSLQFDRKPDDVFAVQDEIAQAVADALGVSLNPTLRKQLVGHGTTNLDAYLAFIQGRSLMSSRKIADGERAIERFSRAITLDPQFSAAYAALADANVQLSGLSDGTLDRPAYRQALRTAAPLLAKALELDPSVSDTYVVRAELMSDAGDEEAAEADLRRAIALNPNDAKAFTRYADYVSYYPDRYDEALALSRQASRIDPLTPRNHYLTGLLLLERGFVEEAEVIFVHTLELAPDFYPAIARLGLIRHITGELAEAVKLEEQALAIEPRVLWLRRALSEVYLDLEDARAAGQILEEVGERRPETWLPIHLYERKLQAAAATAFAHAAYPESDWVFRDLLAYAARDHALASGQFDKASEYLDSMLRKDARGNPIVSFRNHGQVLVLAQLRLAAGDNGSADTLAKASLGWIERDAVRYGKYWLEGNRAVALALLRRDDEAIGALTNAFSNGMCWRWWYTLQSDAAFVQLRHNPRFQSIVTRTRAQVAEQRAILEDMRSTGRVPDRSRR